MLEVSPVSRQSNEEEFGRGLAVVQCHFDVVSSYFRSRSRWKLLEQVLEVGSEKQPVVFGSRDTTSRQKIRFQSSSHAKTQHENYHIIIYPKNLLFRGC